MCFQSKTWSIHGRSPPCGSDMIFVLHSFCSSCLQFFYVLVCYKKNFRGLFFLKNRGWKKNYFLACFQISLHLHFLLATAASLWFLLPQSNVSSCTLSWISLVSFLLIFLVFLGIFILWLYSCPIWPPSFPNYFFAFFQPRLFFSTFLLQNSFYLPFPLFHGTGERASLTFIDQNIIFTFFAIHNLLKCN